MGHYLITLDFVVDKGQVEGQACLQKLLLASWEEETVGVSFLWIIWVQASAPLVLVSVSASIL